MTAIDRNLNSAASGADRRLWLFRPPRLAAMERDALEECILAPEFGVRGDLSDHFERDDVLLEIEEANPGESRTRIDSWATQLHLLLQMIQPGDLIVVPLRRSGEIGIAMARPEICVTADDRPGRRVEWLRTGISRTAFLPDLIHSFGAQQHVCAIARNDAVARIIDVLETGRDPGTAGSTGASQLPEDPDEIERMLRARCLAKIGSSFSGHALADLVGALLDAEGYLTRLSPPGPDGGVDILAGRGIAGLGEALVVQVKSGDIVADAPALQQLIGAMTVHGAGQGLLVSWGGVTRTVRSTVRDNWFRVRVWEAADLLDAVMTHHDALPLALRDRLGMRKVLLA